EFPSNRSALKGYINGIEGEVSSVYYTDTAYITVPFTVDVPGYVYVGGVPLNDSEYLAVGATKPTTVKPADSYAYLKDGVLTLHNFSYTGLGYVLPINGIYGTACAAIFTMNPLDIRLEGQNSISIYEEGLEEVAICILHNSDSTIYGVEGAALNMEAGGIGIAAINNLTIKDCVIYSEVFDMAPVVSYGSINIENCEMTLSGLYSLCSYTMLTIDNSTITAESNDTSLVTMDGDIVINESTLDIKSIDTAVRSDDNIIVTDSNVNIESIGTGIFTFEEISVTNSDLKIFSGWEAIDSSYLTVRGGTLYASSSGEEAIGAYINAKFDDYCDENCQVVLTGAYFGIVTAELNFLKCDMTVISANGHALKSEAIRFDEFQVVTAASTMSSTPTTYVPAQNETYCYVKVHTHNFSDEWTVDVKPTVNSVGQKSRHCAGCDEVRDITEIDKIEMIDSSERFTDVSATSWAKDGIDYVVSYGYMNGTGNGSTFSPSGTMSRSMIVTVLYRIAGQPSHGEENPFTDVGDGWYYDAVLWAYENGIVTGTSATTFAPNGDVTREQMATFLYRFAKHMGYDTSAKADLTVFPDEGKVGSWAYDALAWANAEGLITGAKGSDGAIRLDPQGKATREQVATILMRFCKTYEE
ncbi:MAG: S-layer homology domain-containing protein, partial [Clostridia bacterium]|nr:S-layer homology domain-containing protein [Clostridia bacterium]